MITKKTKRLESYLLIPMMLFTFCLFSCKSNAQEHSEKERTHKEGSGHDKDNVNHGSKIKGHDSDRENEVARGEHKRENETNREGEEDGTQLELKDIYNVTKHGVKLILKYNSSTNSFEGMLENLTSQTIKNARVEVHLSNGTELGPTVPANLSAKMKKKVVLKATEKEFNGWSAHAEVGNLEHSGKQESREGHDKKEKGEHRGNKREHN